ncbi:Neuropeptide-like precursor 1 [Clarias magur]|uniref:Neuropeptide-like 1 n=1 Tax=Clarias magur TaxID=1594786 RepID=A0A8J4X8J4_CLAMG|nr:Neuropeptide-like precursor 1 [Clarias magur]
MERRNKFRASPLPCRPVSPSSLQDQFRDSPWSSFTPLLLVLSLIRGSSLQPAMGSCGRTRGLSRYAEVNWQNCTNILPFQTALEEE